MDVLFILLDILDIFILSLKGILEAAFGLLWPTNNPEVRRLQRTCLIVLVVGFVLAFLAFVSAGYCPVGGTLLLVLAACICFMYSGYLGNKVEALCKNANRRGRGSPSEVSNDEV